MANFDSKKMKGKKRKKFDSREKYYFVIIWTLPSFNHKLLFITVLFTGCSCALFILGHWLPYLGVQMYLQQ
jgi:hypothetical protein